MENFFKLKEHKTTVRTEIIAGITTFLTMAYILAVNPDILSAAGMPKDSVFVATALSACIATLIMAFVANLPFALAPGMGLNAFFAFTVVLTMGYSWQFALTAVFLEGIIFLILTLLNVREAIINCIPANIKKAISGGIGLFIAFIGLTQAGIVVASDATYVTLGDLANPSTLLAIGGLILIGILIAFRIKGAMLCGIVTVTVVGIFFGVTDTSNFDLFKPVPSLQPIFFQFEFDKIFSVDMLVVLFTFLFVDMFDTVGTLIGVTTKAKMVKSDGSIPKVKEALLADAIGTTAGAALGTSTVTTYVESASGVEEGGRTGLTALTVGVLFFLAIFLSPLFLLIPGAATAPVLILVGLFMMVPVKEINWEDITEGFPAFLTLIVMPLTYNIANGIVFGMLFYVILKVLTGKTKDVPFLTFLIAVVFAIFLFVH